MIINNLILFISSWIDSGFWFHHLGRPKTYNKITKNVQKTKNIYIVL